MLSTPAGLARGVLAASVALSLPIASLAAVPDYVPTGSGLFDDYTALEEPRADVPVGALWVQGFGPHGEGAAADNLVTVRSLSGVTLNRDQQFRLTLGLLNFLNIDPAYRSHLSARFSEITIVRVKDVTKLTGPVGEPRIFEALRAATITITVDSDLGLDLGGKAPGTQLPVLGRTQTGRKRSITLDGRDLFIAYRVAIPKVVAGPVEEVLLKGKPASVVIQGIRVDADTAELEKCLCGASSADEVKRCASTEGVALTLTKPNPQAAAENRIAAKAINGETTPIPLPVPISDGKGGVFTSMAATLIAELDTAAAPGGKPGCSSELPRKSRLVLTLQGERLQTLQDPKARAW